MTHRETKHVAATAIFICGLPGAGKTTLARRLERERPAVRFSEDEWVTRLYGHENAHDNDKRELIKAVQWETATRIMRLGIDAVFDWGLWSRAERDDYRARCAAISVRLELRFLDVPLDELWRRISARNVDLPPDTFHIERSELELWWSMFEPPTADELENSDT